MHVRFIHLQSSVSLHIGSPFFRTSYQSRTVIHTICHEAQLPEAFIFSQTSPSPIRLGTCAKKPQHSIKGFRDFGDIFTDCILFEIERLVCFFFLQTCLKDTKGRKIGVNHLCNSGGMIRIISPHQISNCKDFHGISSQGLPTSPPQDCPCRPHRQHLRYYVLWHIPVLKT